MPGPTVKFKRPEGFSVDADYIVLVDGEQVGSVRKRVESYTGIQRGGRYTYWDFRKPGERERLVDGGTSRARVTAEALVKLGMDDAARVADPDHADFHINKRDRGW